nr:glycosyltransferase family 2 protein [uncultured Flavobacterium sp.]
MSKLSIITINFNNAEGLQKTIESVKAQNYSDMEYIIIDGGSTDKSVEVIKENETIIDKWVSEKDKGIYNALNKGIEMATGDYLLFLNSGDQFYNSVVLINNEHHIHSQDIIAFDIHLYGLGHDYIHSHPDELQFSFLFEETFAHQSVFIKRSLFDKIGLYDETLKVVSDWKFFIYAIASGATYKCIHDVLSTFYFGGISSTAEGTFIRKAERENVLKNEFFLYYKDYKTLQEQKKILNSNRFKLLAEIEKSHIARKIVSLFFRSYIVLFSKQKLKNIIK